MIIILFFEKQFAIKFIFVIFIKMINCPIIKLPSKTKNPFLSSVLEIVAFKKKQEEKFNKKKELNLSAKKNRCHHFFIKNELLIKK